MKNTYVSILMLFAMVMVACSGSETYRGSWKGMKPNGEKVTIDFTANVMTITDSTKSTKTFDYTQNSVSISGSIETYGITVKDGRVYQIYFPVANDESIGLIKDADGNNMYTISRNNYVTNEDINKLQ